MSDAPPPEPTVPFPPGPRPDPPPAQQALVEIATGLIMATGFFPAGSPDPTTIKVVDMDEQQWTNWQASPPGHKHLQADGTVVVTPPPPPPIVYAQQQPIYAQVRTTDAVALEVFRYSCDARHLYRADLRVSGVDATSGAVKIMEGRFVWKRPGAAAVVVGITVVSDIHDAAATNWAPNCQAQGTDIVFTVVGAAGRTIDWLLTGELGTFAPEGL